MSPNEAAANQVMTPTSSYGGRPRTVPTTVQHGGSCNARPYTGADNQGYDPSVVMFAPTFAYASKGPMPEMPDESEDDGPVAVVLRTTVTAPTMDATRTIFVTSFPTGLAEEQVEDHLKMLCKLYAMEEPNVVVRRDRMSCLYAYVELASPEQVALAVEQLASEEINGVRLRFEAVHVNSTLYLSRPGRVMSEEQLKEMLDSFEPAESMIMCKPQEITAATVRRTNKTAAFVTYADHAIAERALSQLSAALKDWYVGWEIPATDTPTPNTDLHTLFLGGLNRKAVTKELVRDRFKAFGNIVAVDLILNEGDEKNRSAFAFVRFAEPYSAPLAIEVENATEWLGKRIRVQFCEPPEVKQRRRSLQAMYPLGASHAMPMLAIPNYYIMPTEYSQAMGQMGTPYVVNAGPMNRASGIRSNAHGTATVTQQAGSVNFLPMPAGPATAPPMMGVTGNTAPYGWTIPTAAPNMMMQYGSGTSAAPQHYVMYTPPVQYGSADPMASAAEAMQNMRIQ